MANVTIGGAATSTTTPLPIAVSIDATQDLLPIYTASATATQAISRNVLLGLSSQPLGLTDTQSPQNKTFDNTNLLTIKDGNLTLQNSSSVTKQARFSLSGITAGQTRIMTLPDYNATLASLAGTETLTNKTLTSPTITGGTIDNTAITVDSISGHTSATLVTVANLSISNGVLNTNNSVKTTNIQNAAVTSDKVSLSPQTSTFIAGTETTTSTTYVDLATTTDTITVTVGANGVLLVGYDCGFFNSGSNNGYCTFSLSGSNTLVAADKYSITWPGTAEGHIGGSFMVTGLSSGSTTVKMKYRVTGGTGSFNSRQIWAVAL